MDNETYLESRSEQPTWFRAPSNLIECCMFCGLAIQPGELIAEVDDDLEPESTQYLHESCYQADRDNV